MPAKRIVILEKEGPEQFRYLMWADVPVARQTFYANASATSAWKGATQSDIDALKAGQVVERTDRISKPGATLPQIQAELEATWQAFQDDVTLTRIPGPAMAHSGATRVCGRRAG